jgi:uncharacterized protein (TIGR02145 family)
MKKYFTLCMVLISICFYGCDQKCQGVVCLDGAQCVNGICLYLPTVTTNATVTSIGLNSATCSGQVVSNGGAEDATRGVCWSTDPVPTIDDNKTQDGAGLGNFTSNLTGLSPNTNYYFRAYATNGLGTSYGAEFTFTTENPSDLPVVTTSAITTGTSGTANGGGNVTDEGGAPVTARGVCWSTITNPTLSDNFSSDGTGPGTFSSSITGIIAGTMYYVRAYATNANGTVYGNQLSFTADGISGSVSDIDGNAYGILYLGTQVWMASNLKTTRYNNGSTINTGLSNSTWASTAIGAYAIYNDVASNNSTYGKLYNWFAVNDSRNICPIGWHMPNQTDWNTLITYLGGSASAGGALKTTGTTVWASPNSGATNSSNFGARGGGKRNETTGAYAYLNNEGYFWTSTQGGTSTNGIYFKVIYTSDNSFTGEVDKNAGFSCRCIQD